NSTSASRWGPSTARTCSATEGSSCTARPPSCARAPKTSRACTSRESDVTTFIQFVLLGLGSGSLAALLGLGLVFIYRGSGTINFAHGAFALLGGYLVYELNTLHGWPLPLSMVIACLGVGLLGVIVQVLLLRPLRGKSALV